MHVIDLELNSVFWTTYSAHCTSSKIFFVLVLVLMLVGRASDYCYYNYNLVGLSFRTNY